MERNLKILLLEQLTEDDNLIIGELKKGDFYTKTLIVNNKADFLRSLSEFCPDIILSDHSLRDFNTTEALKILKELNLNIPFILNTKTETEEYTVHVLSEGAEEYILKSNIESLPASIVDLLEKHQTSNETKKTQENLDAHHRLLFRIENSSLGYVEWSVPELTIKSISKRALEIFGLTETELSEYANTGYSEVYKEDLALARKKAKELIDCKLENNYAEHTNRNKDGSILHCEWFNSTLKDENGNVTAIMSLVQDITERKVQEADLLQSKERYRRIVETSQEGILTMDENNEINFVNEKLCRLLEYSKEQLMGKSILDFMDDKGRIDAAAILESQLTEQQESFECCFISKSGKEVCTIISTNAIFGEDNKYLGALAMVTDITERKGIELETLSLVKRLEKKNNDLQQFSFMVSHNLRSPIAKIQGLTQLFGNMQRDEAFNRILLSNISRETENLDHVVKDMNSIVTARDSENLKREFFSFEDNVKLIEEALQNEIVKSNTVITTDFNAIPGIETVKSYLYSIIYNLVSNSLKYRMLNRQLNIHIESAAIGDFVCVSVKDNGTGIDLVKNGEKIFGLYKRVHEGDISGRGLGLNMVKTQAESLGGRAEVESILGSGSTFKIYLPK